MAEYSTYTSPINRMGAISQVGQGIQNQRLQREEAPLRQGLLASQGRAQELNNQSQEQQIQMVDRKLKETDFAANAYEALLAPDDTTMLGIIQQRMPDFFAAAQQEQATPDAMRERLDGLVKRGAALGVIQLPQQAQPKQTPPQKVDGVDAQGNPIFGVFQNGQYINPQTGQPFAAGEFRPAPKTSQKIDIDLGDKRKNAVLDAINDADAKQVTALIDEAAEGSKQNDQLFVLESMIESGETQTGPLEGALVGLKAFAQDLGMNVDSEGLAGQELLRAMTNEMALRLRNPDSGLGLTGNTSDRDVKFLKETVPGLLRSEQGNLALIKLLIARNSRKQEVAQLARDYALKNESMAGFDKYKSSWLDANPLFSKQEERELIGLGATQTQPHQPPQPTESNNSGNKVIEVDW